ncbi:hypothetical protein [Stygiolobus caldivivus]|uniref:Uncharacterized protein n=1 Tax=Stygiolobus caldivivus TaxID=2824673 RepID=A0A8D5U872_9CREN|nr:hypothetical protein [Stygiolobus caldivivus]BCU70835.1 hypothetical protein KN1_21320 [Stygiolobus caldivivus]
MLPLVLFSVLLLHNGSLTHPVFVEYQQIIHFYTVGETVYGLVIENISRVFPNGTVCFEYYNIDLNASEYIGPLIVYNNLSQPTSLYLFNGVGNSTVYRAGEFTLSGKDGNYYVYKNVQYQGRVQVVTYYYVNQTGVPYKIVFLQYGSNGELVGNTTYVLIASSIINPNEGLYFPLGLTRVSNNLSIGRVSYAFGYPLIDDVFTSLLVVSVPLLFAFKVFKKYRKEDGKVK